jgi:hypothetical protein
MAAWQGCTSPVTTFWAAMWHGLILELSQEYFLGRRTSEVRSSLEPRSGQCV